MQPLVRRAVALALAASPLALACGVSACGNEEVPYTPQPAYSGKKANLPPVPTLPQKQIKSGDAYTVWGVTHHLRSRVHSADVAGKELSITGYIVKTNLPDAPACAVHKTGKADKDDCRAPVPTFWIADDKGDEKNAIKVMGWASNFANVYDAIEKYGASKDVKEPVTDEVWSVALPNPLPAVGAKVTVTGTYGMTFTKATNGVETDPIHGILTFGKVAYLEPPTTPATLPGMKK